MKEEIVITDQEDDLKKRKIILIKLLAVFLVFFLTIGIMSLIYFTLKSTYSKNQDQIHVHVVPHSHQDAGWLNTYDEYFYGKIHECSKCIYDNVLTSLKKNDNRTFTVSEMTYFSKWFYLISKEQQNEVRDLVKKGKIDVVNGGWVMNDQADSHYQDIIENLRRGLIFVKKEFDRNVTIGWSLDPFGQSAANAYLMKINGFNQQFIDRVDYKDSEIRRKNKELMFLWQPFFSIDNGTNSIKTYMHHKDNYNIYPEITEPINGNDGEFTGNFDLQSIEKMLRDQKSYFNTNHIILLYGNDFNFLNSETKFRNMERLIKLINDRNRNITMFFSTPQKFFDSVYKTLTKDIVDYKDNDFFPYATKYSKYWTGYFTSRPYLKSIVRLTGQSLYSYSLFLTQCSLLIKNFTVNSENNKYINSLDEIRQQLTIAQHHDAVSGTAENYVSDDYIARLNSAIKIAFDSVSELFKNLINLKNLTESYICYPNKALTCNSTLEFTSDKTYISFINPGINSDNYLINIKTKDTNFDIFLVQNGTNTKLNVDFYRTDVNCEAIFFIPFSIQKLFTQILVVKQKDSNPLIQEVNYNSKMIYKIYSSNEEYLSLEDLTVTYKDFKLNQTTTLLLKHSSLSTQKSGAYILDTNQDQTSDLKQINVKLYEGVNFYQVNVYYEKSLLIYRLFKIKDLVKIIEVDSLIVKSLSGLNIEYLLEVVTNLDNKEGANNTDKIEFWTDSNAMKMMKRVKNTRPYYNFLETSISSNFYPVNSAISIREQTQSQTNLNKSYYENIKNSDKILTIFNDRAQGGSSIEKGKVILDLNRVTTTDDGYGLDHFLDEPQSSNSTLTTKHFILIQDKNIDIVRRLVQKSPIFIAYPENSSNANQLKSLNLVESPINSILDYQSDCIDVDYFHQDLKNIVFTFYNKNDPYFIKDSCTVKIKNSSGLKLSEVSVNTIYKLTDSDFTKNPTQISLYPQEIRSILVEILS